MADVKSELSFREECQAVVYLFLAEFQSEFPHIYISHLFGGEDNS